MLTIAVGAVLFSLGASYLIIIRRKQLLARKLLTDVVNALEEAHIEYWLDWGTLLGAWREQRILPHDQDLDIGIPLEQEEDARRVLSDVARRHRYACKARAPHLLVLSLPRSTKFHSLRDLIFIDVVFYPNEPVLLRFRGNSSDGKPLFTATPRSALRPLSTVGLHGRRYSAPADPQSYLDSIYGYSGRRCIYEGGGRYRPCRTFSDFVQYHWNEYVFFPMHFLWNGLPLPRDWKRSIDRWIDKISPAYDRVFRRPKT